MPSRHATLTQTYAERSEDPGLTPLATYLLRLVHHKRTNLCVSADVTSSSGLLKLAEEVGDQICVFKTHIDIIEDFTDRTMRALIDVAKRKRFIVFEDRKLADIGNTVQMQYTGGHYQIVRWAHIVNAHMIAGPDVIAALAEAAKKAIAAYNTSVQTEISASPAPSQAGEHAEEDDSDDSDDDEPAVASAEEEDDDEEADDNDFRNGRKQSVVSVSTTISTKTETISPQPSLRPTMSRESTQEEGEEDEEVEEEDSEAALEALGPPPFYRSLLLIAEMSSRENQCTPQYADFNVKHARANKNFVMGFIAQRSMNSDKNDNFITMTPGVQLAAGTDAKGQQYSTPRKVIGDAGSDIMIVGRGILTAPDRRRAALEYRKQGWMAYEERLRASRRRR